MGGAQALAVHAVEVGRRDAVYHETTGCYGEVGGWTARAEDFAAVLVTPPRTMTALL